MGYFCRIRNGRSVFSTHAKPLSIALVLLGSMLGTTAAVSQVSVLTHHYDNSRTGQNQKETILKHSNVNPDQFGKLFTYDLDGQEAGQPLYVPNLFIPALNSTHNVVYAATMHDSVYAFDADNNQGSNTLPLWHVNFLDPDHGITSVPLADEKCMVTGYSEFGIQGTPVIDLTRNAIYVLAMTKENGNYVHKLHALDLSTGAELFGGPTTITASFVVNGQTYNFVDRYQQQRPGLLLQNGVIYVGWGSPGCNIKSEMGWVTAHDAGTLQPMGAFNVSPGIEASAIWMSGAGLAGDGTGVYFSTGDGLFDGPGGSHLGDTVLRLSQADASLVLDDYFTPYNQQFFQDNDLDMSSGAVLVIPGPSGSVILTADKDGTVYLLDPNNLGQYNPAGDFQILQELVTPVAGEVHAGLTFWNNNVYVAAEESQVLAYSYTNGLLSQSATSQTPKATANPSGGIVSSNGTNDGIYWYATFPTNKLFAYDATDLAVELYDSGMSGPRDAMAKLVHFGMPIVANGRVYVNGQTQLSVFGLLPLVAPVAGNKQTGVVGQTLRVPLKAKLRDPYTGKVIPVAGVPVTFKSSSKDGSFSNPNAVTDNFGTVSTTYTLPSVPGVYTVTASSPGYASAIFTETAIGGDPVAIAIASGNRQSAMVNSPLPAPLQVKVKDAQGNGVAGIAVTFSDGGAGGVLTPLTATTDSSGIATTTYTTGTKADDIDIKASATGVPPVKLKEIVLPGPATSMTIYAGNNQTIKAGKKAPKLLEVLVTDQYGNAEQGVSVTFSDNSSGGSFVPNPVATNKKGLAGTRYTAPTQTGTLTVTASAADLTTVAFTLVVE